MYVYWIYKKNYLPTFLRGTFIANPPLSGSFLPFKAGSAKGSTPLCQSAQVSLTDIIILKTITQFQLLNIVILENIPSDQILFIFDRLPHRFPQNQLHEILQFSVNIPPDGIRKYSLHSRHQNLQTFDHCDDFD